MLLMSLVWSMGDDGYLTDIQVNIGGLVAVRAIKVIGDDRATQRVNNPNNPNNPNKPDNPW